MALCVCHSPWACSAASYAVVRIANAAFRDTQCVLYYSSQYVTNVQPSDDHYLKKRFLNEIKPAFQFKVYFYYHFTIFVWIHAKYFAPSKRQQLSV